MNRPDDSPKNSILIYTTEDGLTKIDTTFDGDTVWLSIDQMAELFQRDKSTISRHIKNIFAEGELERDSVVAKFATTAADGKTYQVEFYNLDVIISVAYRVKSKRGTQFRIWATGILKEYMRKGFALDDERLKNLGGGGYFKELLERIRDIRASEAMQIDGYSLDAQKAHMKAYADFSDYQIVGEYEDAGKSGKSIEDRASFCRMMYYKIEEAENNLMDARAKKQAIEADKITGDNIYKVLVCFEKLYNVMNPLERKKLMEHLISEIQIYPERQPNGQWLKSIKFRLPIVEKDIDLCLDNESHTECVLLMSKVQ